MGSHCKYGHEFTPENTYSYRYGDKRQRACKTCTKRRNREYEVRRKSLPRPPKPTRDPLEHLFSRSYINPITGCVVWMGGTTKKGYGHLKAGEEWRYVHRLSYEYFVGPIKGGLTVDHLCWNQRCIAPAHLELCTRSENSARRHARS